MAPPSSQVNRKEVIGLRTQIVGWRRGTAAVAGALCVAALVAIVLLATSAGGSNGSYTVRAIFDDAGNVISGENVKIDGVKVGIVGTVTPTAQSRAAVVLNIENPGFQDFRNDASCTIEPEALIGEKFVNCLPTQPRAAGTPLPPPLHKIPNGQEGAGEYLLPVTNTSSPVDVDLLQDIQRRPEAERFTIIINELGAGLAGRGSDLNVVVKRADPALRELDKVLAIFAGENKTLAKLAVDSNQALAPFAAVRNRVADFIVQSNTVARATAEHRAALAQNLADFPAFLRQLGPAAERIGAFAEQTTPVFRNLAKAAPGINAAFTNLPAFANSSTTFFTSLGKTARTSGPAIASTLPLLSQVQKLGSSAKPFAGNLDELLTSLKNTGGLERFLDFVFLGGSSLNGYDSLGHFLRAEVIAKNCVGYKVVPQQGCNANFVKTEGSAASAEGSAASASAAGNSTSLVMDRTLAVLKGATPAQAIAKYPGSVPALGSGGSPLSGLGGEGTSASTTTPVGGASGGTTYYTPSAESSGASGMLLNYLLGN
jgi:phospholipid/cholesterol/gamma-HCH transport system substrate-binding protein